MTERICAVDGCDKGGRIIRGMCEMHRRRERVHGDASVTLLNRSHDGVCTLEGCDRPYKAKGMCDMHAQRVKANGSTDRTKDLSIADRFWSHVREDEYGCWIWHGARDKNDYGTFSLGHSNPVRAHRWSYEYLIGEIPPDLDLDHLCFVTSCVNPYHLDPVTPLVNNRRRDAHLRAIA